VTVAAMNRRPLSADSRRILVAQALRALIYGLGSVLLGSTLAALGLSPAQTGLVLAAVVGGAVTGSVVIGRYGDRWGRRRTYAGLYVALAATGVVFASTGRWWVLALVALGGALSTEVVESGPFTSLEQAMLATDLAGHELARGFSLYNAVAAAAGSLGALAAALPGLTRHLWAGAPADQRWFLAFVPVAVAGAAVARSLSASVEASTPAGSPMRALGPSRGVVTRLAGLFALDSFAGGFTLTAFIAYWFAHRFGTSTATLGALFAAVGVLQTASFLVAGRLAERFGLLATMVGSHLPSNLLLASLAFAPNSAVAAAVLLARVTLSQMDVPTRQAYVMALVTPGERTAAAATTNTVRYVTRPVGAALGGIVASAAIGAPFLIAGSIKSAYDVVLWRWFRRVPLPKEPETEETTP
jgi:predicted MFS family arabinose efflux permease